MNIPGRTIHWKQSTESTMRDAAQLAEAGAASGTVAGADEQTAGIGRLGRSWYSEPESGLYVSIILRLPLAADAVPVITLALGLAAQQAILIATDVICDLRWPNDLIAGGKKCAGILAQLDGGAVIAGIGINVNQTSFPEAIADAATSLRLVSGREHSRERLLRELLKQIDVHCQILLTQGKERILELFSRASTYASGLRVSVQGPEKTLTGTTAGLTADGFLLLRADDGREHTVIAGGVRRCS